MPRNANGRDLRTLLADAVQDGDDVGISLCFATMRIEDLALGDLDRSDILLV